MMAEENAFHVNSGTAKAKYENPGSLFRQRNFERTLIAHFALLSGKAYIFCANLVTTFYIKKFDKIFYRNNI